MKRRKYLKYISSGTVISLSGCLSRLEEENDTSTDQNPILTKRVIEPDHKIVTRNKNKVEWDPHYLGRHMNSNSELDFDVLNAYVDDYVAKSRNPNTFSVRTFNNETDVFTYRGNIDYSDRFVAVVEKARTISGNELVWTKVETLDDSYVLHGYIRKPLKPKNDSPLSSVVSIEKSDDIQGDKLYIALVVTAYHKVIFNSDEGVVKIDTLS